MRSNVKNISAIKGYSLTEVLIGIAISSILFSMSIPSLSEINTLRFLKHESHKVKHELEDVLVKAQIENTDHEVIITQTSITSFQKGNPLPFFEYNFPKKIQTDLRTPLKVSLYKSGVASPTTITLKSGATTCKIKISLRGRVTVLC